MVNLTPQKSAIPRASVGKTDTLPSKELAMTGKTEAAPNLGIAGWYGPAPQLADRGVHDLYMLVRSYRSVSGPAFSTIGREIIRQLKKVPGWRSPYSWFKRTNVKHAWVIVSYHHRAQLCWAWSLWFSIGKATRSRSWNPLHWFSHGYGQTSFGLPWLFQISFHRNSSDWMVSSDAENLIRFVASETGLTERIAQSEADEAHAS